MPKCVKIRRKKRQVCIGDMEDQIVLQSRSLTPPASGVDASETFGDDNTVWAMVETVTGETVFDSTGTERDVTHRFTIYSIAGLTAETWILFNNERFDVLTVEDYEERGEFMLLRATNRGLDANEATHA